MCPRASSCRRCCLWGVLPASAAGLALAVRVVWKSHLLWLLLNVLIYGYNDLQANRLGLEAAHAKARWYADRVCRPVFLDGRGGGGGGGIFDYLGAGCIPKAMTPAQIEESLHLNASYAVRGGDPPIMVVRGLLSEKECDVMIEFARELGVDTAAAVANVDTNEKKDTSIRSNTRVGGRRPPLVREDWWDPDDPLTILHGVRETLAKILRTTPRHQESANLQATARGQHFARHHDFSYHQVEFLFEEGPRTWTSLTYLSGPKDNEGGTTAFPSLEGGLQIKPGKGDAIIWPNAYDGTLIKDFRTFHAGTPVSHGVKYTLNNNFRAGHAREEQRNDDLAPLAINIYGEFDDAPIRRFAEWWRTVVG